jgi:flavin reductase (DIM6/NTAB) family NADH-FMN oxidoreductase RutF
MAQGGTTSTVPGTAFRPGRSVDRQERVGRPTWTRDDGPVTQRWESAAADLGRRLYPMLNCLVAPRPIAWVSTMDDAGVVNLAPHSYFTVSSATPPVVQFTSIGRKDSLRNVEATGEFVVNVVPWRLREAVNLTSIDAPAHVDELAFAGLTAEPSVQVRPPRVAQSPAVLECRLLEVRSFGELPRSGHVVFGEVVQIAVDAAAMADDGLPDLTVLGNATRADRSHWAPLGELVTIERPTWPKDAPVDGA